MPLKCLVNFTGRDLLASTVDDLFDATGNEQVFVLVQEAAVAGAEPAIRKRACIRRRVVLVSV
jgi:hypothetical protein